MSWATPLKSATTLTRRALPSHQPWIPLPYMLKAVEHLEARGAAGLALDPGLRKTSITLEAFRRLKEDGMVQTMLVVAPLRVCRTVWRQEGAKWSEFRHLKFSLLHGSKKAERLKDAADVFLINPEGVVWLAQQFFGRSLPFDIVTIDELTKFKNAKSERSKALRPRLKNVARRWGLTGSLMPNGYMDLFGQQLMLDEGAALGRYITGYRDTYFQVDFNGFDYNLQPGAEKRIIARIAPYWLQMNADDYLQLPQMVPDPREIDMEPGARKIYDKMKKDMLAELPGGVVTAANAAACYSKLSQMANGAVYLNDAKDVEHIHDTKLDALEELVEELNGQPLLVAYEFNHDLDRLRARFGDIPHLGKGTTEKQEADYIARWNRNELPILACHPASAGHGLNLQEGNAAHLAWFGITWDFELYDQFIKRIRRSGNNAQRIFNHILMVRGTIDELKLDALRDKNMTQSGLLRALNTEILRDAETGTDPEQSERETRLNMSIAKLSRQTDAAQDAPRTVSPKGWGKPAIVQNESLPERTTAPAVAQRERIAAQLTGGGREAPAEHEETQPEPASVRARQAFSGAVNTRRQELEAPQGEANQMAAQADAANDAPAKTRTPRTKPAPAPEPSPFVNTALLAARVEVLKLVFGDGSTSLEDGMPIVEQLMAFVEA